MIPNLKLNPSNPRTISKIKYDKLLKSIESFTKMLELRPIIYDEDGVIWGGNMRYRALKQLVADGLVEDKPEYYKLLENYTEEEKKEFAIRDNVELGDWDMDLLANEWGDLPLDEWGVVESLDSDGEEKSKVISDTFEVVIECEDESQQKNIYNKLISEGYKCRVLTL